MMRSPSIESIAEQCSETNGEDAVEDGDLTQLEEFSEKHRLSVHHLFRKADMERVLPTPPIQNGILAQSTQFKNLYVQHLYRLKEGVNLDRPENAWKQVSGGQEILRYVVSLPLRCLRDGLWFISLKCCVCSRAGNVASSFVSPCLTAALDLSRHRGRLQHLQMVRS